MRALINGAERMSALWMKSLAHCSKSVAIRAQVRLSPRLINQSALQTRDAADGVKATGVDIGNVVPLDPEVSCCDI
jgi:hypothetical protein